MDPTASFHGSWSSYNGKQFIIMKSNLNFIGLSLFVLVFSGVKSNAQNLFRSEEIKVFSSGQELKNAWAGGLNSCQFSTVDLNMDGKQDMFVFDRIGERVLCFINTGAPGEISYDHEFSYTLEFPDSLQNWALLRDFDCDGKEDIFTNYSSGMRLYRNESSLGEVDFSLRSELTQAKYNFSGTPFSAPIYCIGVDLPGIFDYDDDGDMDIISFTETAMTLYYYKNYGQEIGICDSLNFECVNRCYGKFHESPESFTLFKGEEAQCDFNVIDPRYEESHDELFRHTGGTICNIDLDQNGIYDLILGDVTEPNMGSLEMVDVENGQDSAIVCHMDFPATFDNTLPVDLQLFPGAFYEDVNNDGIRDLIVSPNAFANAEDSLSCWMYINQGLDDLPDFEFNSKTFLQNTMIDLGTGALPVLADINNDGLLDLLVANGEYFSQTLEFTSKIWYFQNTGTVSNPEFTLVDDNFLDIPSHQWLNAYPTFGDLDNDSDQDLIVGEQNGLLHFFRNTAAIGDPAVFELEISPIADENTIPIDVGQFATPQIIDVTDDNILDLVIGEKNGNINLYENTGTLNEFDFLLIEDTIGDVVATNFLGINGYSVPHFFRNADNELELLLGSETGQINHYNNIEGNFLGDFNLVTPDYKDIWEGDKSAVFSGDINGDLKMDLFLGNIGGGLAFYSGDTAEISVNEVLLNPLIRVFPNPSEGSVTVEWNSQMNDAGLIQVFDIMGRMVFQTRVNKSQNRIVLELDHLKNGSYLVKFGTVVSRIVLQ